MMRSMSRPGLTAPLVLAAAVSFLGALEAEASEEARPSEPSVETDDTSRSESTPVGRRWPPMPGWEFAPAAEPRAPKARATGEDTGRGDPSGRDKAASTKPVPPDAGAEAQDAEADSSDFRIAIEPRVGFHSRLGSGAVTFASEETLGAVYGIGASVEPARRYAFGLAYERADLGGGRTRAGGDSASIDYATHALWLFARAFPWRSSSAGVYLGLQIGASFQALSASGSRLTQEPSRPVEIFECDGSDAPDLALGAGVGTEIRFAQRFGFVAEGNATGYRASGDVVSGCAPGVGSTTGLGLRIGLEILFDVPES